MPSLDLQEAHELLLRPRKAVAVLDYLREHPRVTPTDAAKELHLDLRTWYAAVAQLESLGFVAVERVPGGKKMKIFRFTPSGQVALDHLRGIAPLVENSRAALEWELRAGQVPRGSAVAGENLCRLIELAERRADFEELETLARLASEWGRTGEGELARSLRAFLQGDSAAARAGTERTMSLLKGEQTSRSYLKALHTHAATLEYTGDAARAYEAFTLLRTLARAAGDAGIEAEGWLGTAVLKGRRAQFKDAAEHIKRGLVCARNAGQTVKEAKLLANLCFVELFVDPAKALKTSEEALKAARSCGATLIVGRTQLNRALILAVRGDKGLALESLGEARALLREGGEERGAEAVEGWAREVRKLVRLRRPPMPSDWQRQVIELANVHPGQDSSSAGSGQDGSVLQPSRASPLVGDAGTRAAARQSRPLRQVSK